MKTIQTLNANQRTDQNTFNEQGGGQEPLWPLYDVSGFAVFATWEMMMCFQIITFNPLTITPGSIDTLFVRCAFLAGAALAALLHLILRFDTFRFVLILPIRSKPRLSFVLPGFFLSCVSVITFIVALPIEIICICWLISGIGSVLVSISWMERFSLFNRVSSFMSIGASYFIASVIMILSIYMQIDTSFFLVVEALPFVSCVLFLLACKRYDFPASEKLSETVNLRSFFELNAFFNDIPDKKVRNVLFQKILFAAMYSAFFGYLSALSLSDPSMPLFWGGTAISVGTIIASIAMLIIAKRSIMKVNNTLVRHTLSAILISYFICFAVWPNPCCYLGAVIITSYIISLRLLGGYTSREYAITEPTRSHWESVFQKIGDTLGFLCGWLLALIPKTFIPLGHQDYLVIAFAMATVGVVLDSALFKRMILIISPKQENSNSIEVITELEQSASGKVSSQTKKASFRQVTEDIAAEYKLTERQSEIFEYLARGRNISFIKEKLTLSTPTVKSHTYNIYQKLNVHSHQELIDLVEHRLEQERK